MEFLKLIFIGKLLLLSTNSVLALWPEECKIFKGDSCYKLYPSKVTFEVAASNCESNGGELASIPDYDTSEFLFQKFKEEKVCEDNKFDLTIRYENYCRYWIKTAVTQTSFTNWRSGQPDYSSPQEISRPYNNLCIAVEFRTGKWFDDYCYSLFRPYICEYRVGRCLTDELIIPNADFSYCNEKISLVPSTHITVHCNKNFQLIGPSTITCIDGKWTTLPHCIPICTQPKMPSFASLFNYKEIYNLGDVIVFFCDPGFIVENQVRRSHFTMKCIEEGKWSNANINCIPIKKTNIQKVVVQRGKELVLECKVNTNGTQKNEKEDWIWQLGSQSVDSSMAEIDFEGKLHISKFSEDNVGVYTCFTKYPSLQMGQIAYRVAMESTCNESTVNEIRYVGENHSFLINCPHTDSENVKWIRNGLPLIENSRIVIADDGSLVFYAVIFEDSTNYTCVITDKSLCSKNRSTEIRVIGTLESICGKGSAAQDHPWTVSLWNEEETSPFCYGTLIHEKYVVSSAYCISSFYRQRTIKVYVQFGKELFDIKELLKSKNNSTSQKVIAVESVKIHPKYSRRLLANDIGLLRLKDRVEFSETIQPICISNEDFTIRSKCDKSPYLHGTVSGWGSLEMDNGDNGELHEESLTLLPKVICRNTDTLKFTEDMFCANSSDTFPPIFAADFGASFEYIDNEKVYLLGIYSLGERSTHVGDYDYFTKLSSYVPWIHSVIIT